ncbi:MAG: radical SAM protein [Proteobacteria bacterium]|nr:radical SAM protein [Pseudomonadota bacterium]MBU1386335.1 radical SAM protein [Pseudomonadota bacterium]MBU1541379.1 radical SAM protein [Pseudomonadota bacterium]MBU2430463.1 radical SAM protein [Pseudomonadota bacterium]MBU2482496.1 radical SAM protein [Pseudomonadota bacterium]
MKIIDNSTLDIPALIQTSTFFFSTYGISKLIENSFFSEIEQDEKTSLFDIFIEKCGYKNNLSGFFHFLFAKINAGEKHPFFIQTIKIPLLYIYTLLENVYPGNGLHAVKTTDQLKDTAFFLPEDVSAIQTVIDRFPVRLSDHVIRQSQVSHAVAMQYLPFAGELDETGETLTFDGHFKDGVLEQMYQNRVIFLLDKHCPVYCRFCFRKHKSTRKQNNPSPRDVQKAVEYVESHPLIHEILITGGEPLLNRPNIEIALNGLMKIGHVKTIRIASRSVSYYPELFLKNNQAYIHYLIEKNSQCEKNGKRIELGIHFVHPDEVSIQSLDIISRFVKNGIQVYVQTPFLKGLNDDGKTLKDLFSLLRQAGAQIYYIFTPCHTIHGTKEYWTPISQSFQAQRDLRKNISDRCIPKLCTATAIGKIEWNTSGWAVEKDKTRPEYTWIRTPYTLDYFTQFIQDPGQMPEYRINTEGTLDAKFHLDMGDSSLYAGNRSFNAGINKTTEEKICSRQLQVFYSCLYNSPELAPSVSPVPCADISRIHKTCLEIKILKENIWFDYTKEHQEITDVIIHWDHDPMFLLEDIHKAVEQLKTLSHIVSVRLRISALSCSPSDMDDTVIQRISLWRDFSIGNPLRIELETWFLDPDQITDLHTNIVGKLMNIGVNVYANVPLIKGVNAEPEIIVRLADALRTAGIEFHHLFAGGLDIQTRNGQTLDAQRVIDIASKVRTHCSGRQIPLYVVQTPEGIIDFGLDDGFIPFLP